MQLQQAQQLLQTYGQQHVLADYHHLAPAQQQALLEQIARLDWAVLEAFSPQQQPAAPRGPFAPLGALEQPEIAQHFEEYTQAGLQALQAGRVAAVMLAGGQGTRLGADGPKGTVDIGLTRPYYIYQAQFETMLAVSRQAGRTLPVCIMTSDKTHDQTLRFLQQQAYFGYDPAQVFLFRQEMSPCVDADGRVLMEAPGVIATSPNGNGGWYSSLCRCGLRDRLVASGVEYLNVFAVDNVLQKIADPCFIGATLQRGADCGAMVLPKAHPTEGLGVLCLENGRPSIVEYYELTQDMQQLRDAQGRLLYRFGVILNYLFAIERLDELLDQALPVHLAHKAIPYMGPQGDTLQPDAPNGYKLETLIVDMIYRMQHCLPYEGIREQCFAPIKNKTGADSVETARQLLAQNGIQL